MKKLLLSAVLLLLAIPTFAQFDDDFDSDRGSRFSSDSEYIESGFRMGVQLNVGMSTVIADDCKPGFSGGLGWIAEYNFTPELFLQSGLGLQSIAHKEKDFYKTLKLNSLYLQLPIHIGYRFNMGSTALFAQVGPTLGVGVWGSKIRLYYGETLSYFDAVNRFDLGVGGRIGVEFSRFQISAGVNYGVLEFVDSSDAHILVANISAAYMF